MTNETKQTIKQGRKQSIITGRIYDFEQVLECTVVGSYICPIFNDVTYIYYLNDKSRGVDHYYIAGDYFFNADGKLSEERVIENYDTPNCNVDWSANDLINDIVKAHRISNQS